MERKAATVAASDDTNGEPNRRAENAYGRDAFGAELDIDGEDGRNVCGMCNVQPLSLRDCPRRNVLPAT